MFGKQYCKRTYCGQAVLATGQEAFSDEEHVTLLASMSVKVMASFALMFLMEYFRRDQAFTERAA